MEGRHRPGRIYAVMVVGAMVVWVVALGAVGGSATASHGGAIAQTNVDADAVAIRVSVAPDGSATWRVAYRIELDSANTTDAFASLRDDIEAQPNAFAERFADRMRRTMWRAENVTGRDMALGNVSVSATRESLPQAEYGVVVYRLEWAGFATVDEAQLRAGDAIDRFFLDERAALTVAWPADYHLVSVEPAATTVDDNSVTWQGRRDFGPSQPRVVLRAGTPTAGEPPADGGETAGGNGYPLVGLAALALLIVIGGAWAYARRTHRPTAPDQSDQREGATGPPPELLSNQERVLQLLEERGGRMKQQEVGEVLDWTDAKTSQVVGELREAGDVDVFRLGRENVLTLPEVSIDPGSESDE